MPIFLIPLSLYLSPTFQDVLLLIKNMYG